MLEIQIGDNISLKSGTNSSPILLLGSTGQGKSTTLEHIILELVKNKQTGFFYDPYGDLSRNIKKLAVSDEAAQHLAFFDENVEKNALISAISNKFVIVSGNKLQDGGRKTREAAIRIVTIASSVVQKNSWLLIDEALENISDELLGAYLELKNKGINLVLSDVSLMNLSEQERDILLNAITTFIVYKMRNVDALWLQKVNDKFNAKSIAAIKQFHYQYLSNGELKYSPSVWPLKEI